MERETRQMMNEPRRDLLVSKVVAGEAVDRDLAELSRLSAAEPTIWYDVVEAARDDVHLLRLMDRAAAVADGVDVPVEHVHRRASSWRRIGGFAGWAAAAVLVVVAVTQRQLVRTSPDQNGAASHVQQASIPSITTARDAFQTYLDQGRREGLVLSDEPRRVLLDARPASTGRGYELIYVQQVLEKTVVPRLYEFSGQDEQGRPVLVQFHEPVREAM